ncbi:MAG: 2-oxoacid:acceptor oxidoreductase subunit alpha [Hellea sp.]|nr:2-oxoacid:acceptor oxidoreductase subunit alpha [Hellea sp.]
MSGPALNDFVIRVGNVNGTGSASANGLLMKAIFRMGIPCIGKNVFPSNIQGLPTWYEIRVNGDGYMGRSGDIHLMIAMNAETYAKDLACVTPGGYLIYDSTWPRPHMLQRDDITVIGVPLSQMVNETFQVARSRILMKNMAYVGAVAALINMDMHVVKAMVEDMFASKQKLIPSNMQALELGLNYVKENIDHPLPFTLEKMNKTKGKVMIDGNTAAGLGCVYGGATVGAWYPITPSTSLMDSFVKYCHKLRIDEETGEHKFAIIQAEDELAAAGQALGAGWMGARAFTPTSGAGISLMNEFIGFGYYSETPAVFFDVQRVGPSTGMPTRTQQCDIMTTAYCSHGDTKHIVLYPADPKECFEMAVNALDLAERFQTPVFVLSDLDIGMNDWMIDELTWDDSYVPDRGKIVTRQQLDEGFEFFRFLDVDGDGIPYRTLPGTHPTKGAYFNRGSGHNKWGKYTEDSDEYKEVVDRLIVKWQNSRHACPQPVLRKASKFGGKKPSAGIIAIGSSDPAVIEAQERLAAEGIHLDYLRVRAFPFADAVEDFMAEHDTIYVVEQNRDAQLMTLLVNETNVTKNKLVSVKYYAGEPLSYKFVMGEITAQNNQRQTA